jgi:hypothetical protein
MRFKPVFLPNALGGSISQTALKHFDACPRSGFLYLLHKGEASTDRMVRGSAGHAALERCVRACVENGEVAIPPDLAKAVMDEVLAEYPVPLRYHDELREDVYRWASETAVDPSAVIACETLIVLEVDGFPVRMKVDFAELLEGGAAVHVADYKFAPGMPTQEEVARKRSDGSLMARSFQLVLYALGLRYGRPVRVEVCAACAGTGIQGGDESVDYGCPECSPSPAIVRGAGRIETPEPFPLAERAQRFDLEYVYPGIEDRDGKMGRRRMSLSALELDAYLHSLGAVVARLREAERTGDWPAQTSDAACSECPAPRECPIPAELRDHAGRINTREEAEEAAEKLEREKALHRARQAELKAWAKANGGALRVGQDKVQEFVATRSEEIKDKEGLWVAVERAVRYGEPFERSEHVVEKTGTSFKVRKLTADELAAEAAEGVSDGNGNAGLDERFGADAPF